MGLIDSASYLHPQSPKYVRMRTLRTLGVNDLRTTHISTRDVDNLFIFVANELGIEAIQM